MTEASHHKDEALRSSAALKKRRERHATWLMYFGLLSLLVGVLMFVLPLFSEGEQRQGWLMRLSEPFQSILRKLAEGPPPPTNDPEKQSERSLEITRERAREREMAEREMRSSERRIGRERRDLLGEKRADLQEEIQTRLAIEDGRIEELRRRRKHLELERQRIDEEIKAAEAGEYSKSPRGAGPRWDALALKRLQMERRQIEDLVAQEDLRLRAAEEMRTELLNRRIAEVEAAAKRRAQEARHEQLEEEARKEAYLARMKDAHVAFNHPKEMYVSRRTQVTLALAPSQQKAQESLVNAFERAVEGEIRTGSARFAPHMLAKLHGKDFKIEAAGPDERLVLEGRTAEWTWYVEPLVVGTGKLLRLELLAVLSRAEERLPPLTVRTFDARINVNVRLWDRILIQAREMQPVAVVLSSLGVLGTAFALYLKISEWWRRRLLRAKARQQQHSSIISPASPSQPAIPSHVPSDWVGH